MTHQKSSPASWIALTCVAVLAGVAPLAAQSGGDGESALTWRIPTLPPPKPISMEEYAARRRALADGMSEGVLIVFGARAPAYDYMPYQQNPNFRFLTGIDEPDAALVVFKSGGRVEEWLFVQSRSPAREVWEGARLGPQGAREQTGIEAQTNDRVLMVLDSLLNVRPVLHALDAPPAEMAPGTDLSYDQQVLARVVARRPQTRVQTVDSTIHRLRARKSPVELDRIRRAVYISAEAHRQAMQATEPRLNEFEIRSLVEYYFLRNGGDGPAYASIVGSGPNSTTLHYNADDRCMNDGEVLLFDVGAYFQGYAADVTRTIPVNGKFTPEQRSIYEIVLAAQKAAETRIRRGARWNELTQAANVELSNGLARLGLIDAPDAQYDCGTAAAPRKCLQYRMFYMHGLGHGVGLEVHDPDISTTAGFQPGSAVTIEPGLYVRADVFDHLPDTPDNRALIQRRRATLTRYQNIGVRIEDVYIFDENGVERASRGAPREIAEIESLMRESTPAAAGRRADVVGWRCPVRS
ncbi:MAG: aminopeptidase P N-terminal domain-containing protein [Longimicrobiales bacterium]